MKNLFPSFYQIHIEVRQQIIQEALAEKDWTVRLYDPERICLHEYQYWKIYGKPDGHGYISATGDFVRQHPWVVQYTAAMYLGYMMAGIIASISYY